MRWLLAIVPHYYLPAWIAFISAFCVVYFLQDEGYEESIVIVFVVNAIFTGIYGAYRARFFHPLTDDAYRQFLKSTPWTHKKPLLRGPVHLVGQDAILLSLHIAVTYLVFVRFDNLRPTYHLVVLGFSIILTLAVFLFFYIGALWISFLSTGAKWPAYFIAITIILGLRLVRHPESYLPLLIALYLLALWGVRVSLKNFPWADDAEDMIKVVTKSATQNQQAKKSIPSGIIWPYHPLLTTSRSKPKLPEIVAGSVFVGWLAFVVMDLARSTGNLVPFQNPADPYLFAGLAGATIGGGMALVRIAACLAAARAAAPISLWGRIRNGLWIIPEFDRFFLNSLALPFLGAIFTTVPALIGIPFVISVPLGLAAIVFLGAILPPSPEDWALTGGHRIAAPRLKIGVEEI